MEQLFVSVLNMSVTTSYVILAVLLVRLALRRAPKKYSYLLWSVVGFRLLCPVSFSSVWSLFSAAPFDMTKALGGGGGALTYIPPDIGYQAAPAVTVGIPAMNTVISGSLPAADPIASVNPLQIWVFLGTLLWSVGIAALLLYSVTVMLRLRRTVSTAVHLEGNVFESDQIRSPFLLGLLRPRIYIPFGLGERERECVLRHERYHLKRGDHLTLLLAYLILAVHWFNPLVWLAFALFSRDMEMRCDEAVLSGADTPRAGEYCDTLLSFAASRRFPAATPLAFGETGIRARIKNALRFRRPRVYLTISAAALCLLAVAALAANPSLRARAPDAADLYGTYRFGGALYMNPLSSFYPAKQNSPTYTFAPDSLAITSADGSTQTFPAQYRRETVDEAAFSSTFLPITGFSLPDISGYRERYQFTLNPDSAQRIFRVYVMDGEVWLATLTSNDMIWSIYRLERIPRSSTAPYGTAPGLDIATAVPDAIIAHNAGHHAGGEFQTASHTTLLAAGNGNTMTVYLLAFYAAYDFPNGVPELVSGSHIPCALTFSQDDFGDWTLTEYWEPSEGPRFAPSIREKFPADIADEAINTQRYAKEQRAACDAAAQRYLSTRLSEEELVQTILSSPAESSRPADYIMAHPEEYKALVSRGDIALRYIYAEFLKGGQNGLAGHILLAAMQDLLGDENPSFTVQMPQAWFDAFADHARELEASTPGEELLKYHPKAYLLLQLEEASAKAD